MITVEPEFVFLREDGETPSDATARCAREVLTPGPMGNALRGDDYERFLGYAYGDGKSARSIATSCAVFAGACLVHAEVQSQRRIPVKRAITTWLGVPGFTGSWLAADELEPQPGDIFYVCSSSGKMGEYTWATWQQAANGHVGILVEGHGWEWLTAEGGGSPGGTVCRLSAERKDISKMSRTLRGVWRPNMMPEVTR